ncbi:hypothetical protein [Rathayibacter sp. SD072]|uniref:hypothetical protein n=1 Tax=Rathayibacter sp. SD072 TaxID=2781731 RepID=UPI001A96B89C|nr:hypothetical protein [Rathayibacter sp. SD072]MBO0983547.1 hypothetical protein [Rathayibacter sp. SD072]
MQQPLLTGDVYADEASLNCPHCTQNTGLHVDTIEMHSAGGQTLIAQAHGEDDHANIAIELTPRQPEEYKGRRHTVVLVAWCELCGMSSRISFMQHKGVTEFEIDTAPRRP